MLVSITIVALSLVLFAYWFRYSCILILRTKTTSDYTAQVAEASRLSVLQVQSWLKADHSNYALDDLRAALDRDYVLISQLLARTQNLSDQFSAVEDIFLRIDYRLMRCLYWCTRGASPARARAALEEMSCIVGFFANAAGCASVAAE